MSYMGLFWETGMPEAWALSRKSGEKPDAGAAQQTWPQASMGLGPYPGPGRGLPEDGAGRPAPELDGGKTKD